VNSLLSGYWLLHSQLTTNPINTNSTIALFKRLEELHLFTALIYVIGDNAR